MQVVAQAPRSDNGSSHRCDFRPPPFPGTEIPLLTGGIKLSWRSRRCRTCVESDGKMAERGASKSAARFPNVLRLTRDQVHAPIDVDAAILDTTTDFLRFVTEFFEVISQSMPYIYQTALLFSPKSSVVRKPYGRYLSRFESRIASDIPDSWDSPTTSDRARIEVNCAVLSPHDQLVAVGWMDRVELRNSNTLESPSILEPPSDSLEIFLTPQSLTFSPDGNVLACAYNR